MTPAHTSTLTSNLNHFKQQLRNYVERARPYSPENEKLATPVLKAIQAIISNNDKFELRELNREIRQFNANKTVNPQCKCLLLEKAVTILDPSLSFSGQVNDDRANRVLASIHTLMQSIINQSSVKEDKPIGKAVQNFDILTPQITADSRGKYLLLPPLSPRKDLPATEAHSSLQSSLEFTSEQIPGTLSADHLDGVTYEPLTHAVVLIKCGHSFNENTAKTLMERKMNCPLDRCPIESYVPNINLRNIVQAALQQHAQSPASNVPAAASKEEPSAAAVAHFEKGKQLFSQHQYEQAVNAFLAALILHPTYEKAQMFFESSLEAQKQKTPSRTGSTTAPSTSSPLPSLPSAASKQKKSAATNSPVQREEKPKTSSPLPSHVTALNRGPQMEESSSASLEEVLTRKVIQIPRRSEIPSAELNEVYEIARNKFPVDQNTYPPSIEKVTFELGSHQHSYSRDRNALRSERHNREGGIQRAAIVSRLIRDREIRDSLPQALANSPSTVRELILEDCDIGDVGLDILTKWVLQHPMVRVLNLKNNPFTSESQQSFIKLSKLRLEEIYVGRNKNVCDVLSPFLMKTATLRKLELQQEYGILEKFIEEYLAKELERVNYESYELYPWYNRDDTIFCIPAAMPNDFHLKLNEYRKKHYDDKLHYFKRNARTKFMELAVNEIAILVEVLTNNSRIPLQELTLQNLCFGNAGIHVLGRWLVGNKTLRKLNLMGNLIDTEGAKILANLVKNHPGLEEVNLQDNPIDQNEVRPLFTSRCNILFSNN